jgi:hypothetical protein
MKKMTAMDTARIVTNDTKRLISISIVVGCSGTLVVVAAIYPIMELSPVAYTTPTACPSMQNELL